MDVLPKVESGPTLVSCLVAHANSVPNKEAVSFVANPLENSVETLDYAALDRGARRVAALLQRDFSPGDRALLLYPPGTAFFTAFIGCLYAGVVPAVAPLPDGQRHRSDRSGEMIRSIGASALLTEESAVGDTGAWVGTLDDAPPVIVTDRSEELPGPGAWSDPGTGPDHVAFLQFTSGSTSTPRGVVVRHHNIVDNAEHFSRVNGCGSENRFGGWLPMHHDFGLLSMFLFPLYYGASTVHMPASAFLRRPHSWLHLIDQRDLDFSSSPNFGYDLCVRRITDEQAEGIDLSRWKWALDGAEPVLPATLRRFSRRFEDFGFRPGTLVAGYGLAEATLMVTCDAGDEPPTVVRVDAARLEKGEFHPVPGDEPGRELVRCGDVEIPGSDTRLLIVDPNTGDVLPDGAVGEIWISGSSVTHGYWDRPEETRASFDAATSDGRSGFLRTGDLAVVHGGGLYVTGRMKEVLIYHGRNIYPHDLEAAARSADVCLENGIGAAFTVRGAEDKEEIALVHEVQPRGADADRLEEVLTRIHRSVSREFGVALGAVVLVRRGGVKRTTSGKIQRLKMRSALLDGELKPVAVRVSPALSDAVPESLSRVRGEKR
ncbi:fatty acyl-AMP ligase [Nocardiopsis sp. CNT312]|uniref:fatty acyl-AMP ligase n=1 Tax=Nocardiopsis sp. CNT312 TaxID=1137268 RepID=UPI0004AEE9FE|nr:fatty acyl-AMP ligase [Nocardiopsis sp. CNT312]